MAPELVEPRWSGIELAAPCLQGSVISVVDQQDVRNIYVFDITFAAATLVLLADVLGEFGLRSRNFARKAACGNMPVAIEDDPGRLSGALP